MLAGRRSQSGTVCGSSYRLRLSFAQGKLRAPGVIPYAPADCSAILDAWSGERLPTADELSRLEEVLSNPGAHFTYYRWEQAA